MVLRLVSDCPPKSFASCVWVKNFYMWHFNWLDILHCFSVVSLRDVTFKISWTYINIFVLIFNDYCLECVKCIPTRLEVPKTTPHVQWFTGRTHRTQYIIVFKAMIYYNEGIQSKISKRNRCMGWSPEETRHKFLRFLS